MARMQAVHYRDSQGHEPVNECIDGLCPERQEEIDCSIDLLNRLRPAGPPLPFPFSSQVEGQLRELRCHYGRELYRVLYRRSGNLFILLHILEKRTKQIPEADKQIARERWEDFESRMDTTERRRPRAAGHDAP
jgi:phage-related protein